MLTTPKISIRYLTSSLFLNLRLLITPITTTSDFFKYWWYIKKRKITKRWFLFPLDTYIYTVPDFIRNFGQSIGLYALVYYDWTAIFSIAPCHSSLLLYSCRSGDGDDDFQLDRVCCFSWTTMVVVCPVTYPTRHVGLLGHTHTHRETRGRGFSFWNNISSCYYILFPRQPPRPPTTSTATPIVWWWYENTTQTHNRCHITTLKFSCFSINKKEGYYIKHILIIHIYTNKKDDSFPPFSLSLSPIFPAGFIIFDIFCLVLFIFIFASMFNTPVLVLTSRWLSIFCCALAISIYIVSCIAR